MKEYIALASFEHDSTSAKRGKPVWLPKATGDKLIDKGLLKEPETERPQKAPGKTSSALPAGQASQKQTQKKSVLGWLKRNAEPSS